MSPENRMGRGEVRLELGEYGCNGSATGVSHRSDNRGVRYCVLGKYRDL